MNQYSHNPEHFSLYAQVKKFIECEVLAHVHDITLDGISNFNGVFFDEKNLKITLLHHDFSALDFPFTTRDFPLFDIKNDEDCEIDYMKDFIFQITNLDNTGVGLSERELEDQMITFKCQGHTWKETAAFHRELTGGTMEDAAAAILKICNTVK